MKASKANAVTAVGLVVPLNVRRNARADAVDGFDVRERLNSYRRAVEARAGELTDAAWLEACEAAIEFD